jgi:hypothetical protein
MNKRKTTSNCHNSLVITVVTWAIIIFLALSIMHGALALTSEEIRRLGIEARSSGKPFDQYIREIFYANNVTPVNQKQAFVRLDSISNESLLRCHAIVQHGGLFGKIEQRFSDLLCAATGDVANKLANQTMDRDSIIPFLYMVQPNPNLMMVHLTKVYEYQ